MLVVMTYTLRIKHVYRAEFISMTFYINQSSLIFLDHSSSLISFSGRIIAWPASRRLSPVYTDSSWVIFNRRLKNEWHVLKKSFSHFTPSVAYNYLVVDDRTISLKEKSIRSAIISCVLTRLILLSSFGRKTSGTSITWQTFFMKQRIS